MSGFHPPRWVGHVRQWALDCWLRSELTQLRRGQTMAEAGAETIPLGAPAVVLDRAALNALYDALQRAGRGGRGQPNRSGGSTGVPVTVLHDRGYRAWNRAAKRLFEEWTGRDPNRPTLVLWGSGFDLARASRLRGRVGRWLRNEYWWDAHQLSDAQLQALAEWVRRHRPGMMLAYAEAADLFARHVLSQGLQDVRIPVVMTSAGTLFDDMRQRIGSAFGAEVFNRYGAREVGDIASECEAHLGLHVNPLTHHVEILRPDGSPCAPGEDGDVVVTLKTNRAMPIVRYRIGDVAAWAEGPCTCGRSWPLLKHVRGRSTDYFDTASGDRVYGGKLRSLLQGAEWIRQYQWVQVALNRIELKLVLQAGVSLERHRPWLKGLERSVQQWFGEEVRLAVEAVPRIEPSPSGKHLYTINRLRLPEAGA